MRSRWVVTALVGLAAGWSGVAPRVLATETLPGTGAAPTPADAVQAQLEGTAWLLALRPMGTDEQAAAEEDTVSFEGGQVVSIRLERAGYANAKYTVGVTSAGAAVWEAMHTRARVGIAFWRGEVSGSTMRGMVSQHPIEGAIQDYSFVGREISGQTGSTQAGTRPSPVVAAAARKKKRWGWFDR